jgi:hypothetical protein
MSYYDIDAILTDAEVLPLNHIHKSHEAELTIYRKSHATSKSTFVTSAISTTPPTASKPKHP